MHGSPFDLLTRRLTTHLSRRTGLGLLATLAVLRLAAPDQTAAKKKSTKKKPCPPCKKRKKGQCKKKLPDGTPCTGGTCQSGSCVAVDPCASCTGDEVCIGGACIVPACGAGGPCRVFLSSILYDGNLGGLSGADTKCQGLAAAAGLPGTYRAWLSDTTSSPISRFVQSTGPYRLVTGTTIAANFTDLTDGTLLAPITVTETGGGVGAANHTWTHTQSNGSKNGGGNFGHCLNWSTNNAASFGDVGIVTQTNVQWSNAGPGFCDDVYHLYCFQQS